MLIWPAFFFNKLIKFTKSCRQTWRNLTQKQALNQGCYFTLVVGFYNDVNPTVPVILKNPQCLALHIGLQILMNALLAY